jgi:iron complex transport system substrate-binding protein
MRMLNRMSPSRRTLLTVLAGSALPSAANTAPRRIVSIGGAITETLYALGAQDEVVGVDTTSLYPAAARALPSVGYARQLSAEGVLSLRPTLVITGEEAGPPPVLRALEAARVPLAVLDGGHRFEGVIERSVRIASLCGRDAQGRALVQKLEAQWQSSRERVAVLSRNVAAPRALFVLSHAAGQMRVAGRETAAHAMLGYAGAVNVFGDGFAGYKPLTPEAVIAAAPQVIVATDQGVEATGGIDGLLKAPGLAQTLAGRGRRVVALDALLLLGFGPRLPQAVASLAEAVFAPPAR